MIRAGLLKRNISILSVTQVKSGIGAFSERKEVKYNFIRASIVNQKNNRQMSNNTIIYPYSFIVTIRNHFDVEESDIVLINGNEYRIVSLDDVTDERAIILEVEKIIV